MSMYRHIPILSCILSLAVFGEARAVAVTASVNINGASSFSTGSTFADRRLQGRFGGTDDTGVDRAVAEADLAAGTLRVAALEGGRVNTGQRQALAVATLEDRLTFSAPPGAGRQPVTISFMVDASVDANAGTTGDFVGGITATTFFARLDVDTVLQTPTGGIRRLGGLAQVSHTTRYEFFALTPSIIASAIPSGPFVTPAEHVDPSGGGLTNLVQGSQVILDIVNMRGIDATLEIEMLVGNGDVFDLSAQMSGRTVGAIGHAAGINALNTGRFAVHMPDGFGFTSESGVFLSSAADEIPAPPSILMMLAGLCSFAGLRQACSRTRSCQRRFVQGE